jgi:hypothetical protein
MHVEEQIACVVVRLSDLKLELAETLEQSQEQLRDYVTNTNFPVDDRFEVWSEWCKKRDHGCAIYEADVPLLGKMRENDEPGCYERYEDYDWEHFLEAFAGCDMIDDNEAVAMREKYSVTVDDVRELLIRENFGSFRMDW